MAPRSAPRPRRPVVPGTARALAIRPTQGTRRRRGCYQGPRAARPISPDLRRPISHCVTVSVTLRGGSCSNAATHRPPMPRYLVRDVTWGQTWEDPDNLASKQVDACSRDHGACEREQIRLTCGKCSNCFWDQV